MNLLKNYNIYLLAIVLAVLINIFSWHLPFFWDTILTSTITQYFFEHGFQNLMVPAEFDAGHPPLFYVYVSCIYLILGKNLMATHLSMLPFTILGIISFIQLLHYFFFSKKQQFIGVILFFSIPAVITQQTLVSYDAVLLSLYLAALVSYLNNKKILFSFILIGIVGITLRGLFCLVALSSTIFFISNNIKSSSNELNGADRHPELVSGSINKMNFKSWFKWNVYFVPALVIIASWYSYHYTQTGWFFATPSEGWSEQRGFVDGFGLFKNGVSIARSFFDLGIVLLSFLSLFYFLQKRKLDTFTLLWLIPAILFSISFLPFTNPINHRYFLVVYVLMLFPVIQFLSNRRIVYTVLTTCILLLGHLQIYPVPISNGWDCTLAYTSYHKCIDDFNRTCEKVWFDERKNTATVFPMNASLKQTDLKSDSYKMENINGKSIDEVDYVLFSNVGNDFSDEQIFQLKSWIQFYQVKHGLVEVILYQNPEISFK